VLLQESTRKRQRSLGLGILKMVAYFVDHKSQETHQKKKVTGVRFNETVSVFGWLMMTSAILFPFSLWARFIVSVVNILGIMEKETNCYSKEPNST
jgi:ABC-type transport system involved in cytochrome c biogenesis permease subunit